MAQGSVHRLVRQGSRRGAAHESAGSRSLPTHDQVVADGMRRPTPLGRAMQKLAVSAAEREGSRNDAGRERSNATYAGLDVGDRNTHICVLDAAGKVVERMVVPTEEGALLSALRPYPLTALTFETGTHSLWLARTVRHLGVEPVVANARKVELITRNHRKSDVNDAYNLARLLRADPELLHPVHVRSEASQRSLTMLKARHALVCMRTKAVNTVRGLVKASGHRVANCTTAAFVARAVELPAGLRDDLAPMLDMIGQLTERIHAYDKQIEAAGKDIPAVRRLRSVPGVGPVIALGFVLYLDDPLRFPRSRDVGAYLGLCPRHDQSGDIDRTGHISKTGSTWIRSLLVNAAQHLLSRRGKECTLRRWGLSLMERGVNRRRAAVAVARRLAVLLHRLWVDGVAWDPLRGAPAPTSPPSSDGAPPQPRPDSDDCAVPVAATPQGATARGRLQRPTSDPTMHRAPEPPTKSADRSKSGGKGKSKSEGQRTRNRARGRASGP